MRYLLHTQGRGKVMREIIEQETKEVFTRLAESLGDSNSYNYYQGKIDTLAWVLRQLPDEG